MADVKISALAAGTAITDADLFYYVDGSTSKKVTATILKSYVLDSVDMSKSGAGSPAYFIGTGAGAADLDGNAGTIGIGENALNDATDSDYSTALGYGAGEKITTGDRHTLIGAFAGDTYLTTADSDTFIGIAAGTNASGDRCTYVGDSAGAGGGATSSADDNVAVGYQALTAYTTGTRNVVIGNYAGDAGTTLDDSVLIGYNAGTEITTGDSNTLIGSSAGAALTTQAGCVCIGYYAGAQNTTANLLYISNSNTETPLIWGSFVNSILTVHGQLGLGTKAPATSAQLDMTSTTGALLVPRMNTAARDLLTAVNGMIIYNSQTNAFNFYENGSWVDAI